MSEDEAFYDVVNQGGTGCAACECDSCLEKFYDFDDPQAEIEADLEDLAIATQAREWLWTQSYGRPAEPLDLVHEAAFMDLLDMKLMRMASDARQLMIVVRSIRRALWGDS